MNHNFENNPRWIDGRKSYKRLAFERYKLKKECSICHKKTNLDVHHKDKNHSNNLKSNLVILCGFHHNSLHKKGAKHPWISKLKKGKTFESQYGIKKAKEIKLKISKGSTGKKNGFYGKDWNDFGGHPRGMLGKKHTKQTLMKISKASTKMWKKRRKEAVCL